MYSIAWLNGLTDANQSEADLAAVMAENRLFRVGLVIKNNLGTIVAVLVPHPN